MNSIDPLIHHLHRRGSGSWSFFSRAVEAFDPSLNPTSVSRMLAEHAIVEFDFDNDCDWSVTTVVLVESHNATTAWGGTPRGLSLLELDVEFGARAAFIDGVEYEYDHGLRFRKRSKEWPRGWLPVTAARIRDLVPDLDRIVGSRACPDVPRRRAARLSVALQERVNPGGPRRHRLYGEWISAERIMPNDNAVWKIDRATHLVTRNHRVFEVAPDVALWAGFVAAAQHLGSEHLIWHDGDFLQVASYPRLPVLIARAMLVSGAREVRSERRDRRAFRNVDATLARWLGNKLGVPIR